MNYQKHYNLLIERAKNRLLEGYTERHHIIPKCLGGSNKKENLVRLTPEEHYLAHLLLIKIYPSEPKLLFAANMMCVNNSDNQKRNNKRYGWLKRIFSTYMSKNQKGKPKPSSRGERSEETKRNMSLAAKGKKKKPQTEEHKRKRLESRNNNPKNLIKRVTSDEIKKKISIANTGKKRTEEQKANYKGSSGRIVSKETRLKQSKSRIGYNKGRTYEEIYGYEKAKELKEIRRLARLNKPSPKKGKTQKIK